MTDIQELREVLVTVSGTQTGFFALQALVNPGDEVLIPDPGFLCYEPSVLMAEEHQFSCLCQRKNGFNIEEDVISQITKKSRMMIINSPNNPTGRSYRMVIWQI